MGWRRVAEEELPTLDPQTRRVLQAYADGVNTYLRGRSPGAVSLEYTVLGLQLPLGDIEEWTPLDSLSWLKAMAWDLRGNYDDELARARLSGRVTEDQIDAIYPPYDSEVHPPILSEDEWSLEGSSRSGAPARTEASRAVSATTAPAARAAYAAVQEALDAVPQLVGRGEGVGSNAWAVAGSRTSTGAPLLANDPHLAVGQPGIWIQNSLSCRRVTSECPLTSPASPSPGCRASSSATTTDIAWGFTNLGPDVSDFYLERIIGNTYQRDGEWLPLEQRTRDDRGRRWGRAGDHRPQHRPRPGALRRALRAASDAGSRAPTQQKGDESADYAVSLAWTGLLPGRTADAILGLNLATGFDEFRQAARSFAVPSQNLVYADTEGHIGYQAPGQIPVRRPAHPADPARLLAGAGLGLRLRLAGLRRLRGPAVDARPAGRHHRHGQPAGHGRALAVPHHRVGRRLALHADHAAARPARHGDAAGHGRHPDGRQGPLRRRPRAGAARGAADGPRLRARAAGPAERSPRRPAPCSGPGTARPRPATPTPRRPPRTSTPCGATCASCSSTTSCRAT